jgi:4-hydroxythreonine-4-phosphate dehydrogenase
MDNSYVQLVITSGEPAGIGPQISVQAAQAFIADHQDVKIHLLGDRQLFEPYYQKQALSDYISIEHVPLIAPNEQGQLNLNNAPYVLNLLDRAYQGCIEHSYDAMVTAPLQKSIINDHGLSFTGHTEYLAKKAGVSKVVMMLCGEVSHVANQPPMMMRVALVTTHMALKEIFTAITVDEILSTLQIIQSNIKKYFGIKSPKIMVAGLNPHAGEGGHLGREEIEIITPAIKKAQQLGLAVFGPYPADTMFRYQALDHADVFVAMYHDQGLIPLKMASFGQGVNITLGLPIIRTSVDHGTALDLAKTGTADCKSMYQALKVAYQMVKNGSSST